MTALLAASAPRYDLKKDSAVSAVIIDMEKRRSINVANLTKYYVYFIEVTLESRRSYLIVRRYSHFNTLQERLDDRFPIEAGHSSQRILPTLPGKIYLKRSAVREVADRRVPDLNRYLKKLIKLESRISQHDIVLDFLTPTSGDIDTPIIKAPNGRVQYVTAAEKAKWLAQQEQQENKPKTPIVNRPQSSFSSFSGGVREDPAPQPTAPTNVPTNTVTGPKALAMHDFNASSATELSFKKGDVIPITKRIDANWLEGSINGKVGLVPQPFVKIEDDVDVGWEDEWEDDTPTMVIRCHYEGSIRDIDVDAKVAEKPTYNELLEVIKNELSVQDIALNYQDIEGDLIRIKDQSDIELLLEEAAKFPQLAMSGYVSWELRITKLGDYSMYHVEPYK
ncbi:neutrophil cytosol factor 4-like [Ptychodera flava]|uniref:neutrophil cytosol factor 4-like n=1 Tax=Ptychodera flava TaxID=63121 RepID=UPI00396A3825